MDERCLYDIVMTDVTDDVRNTMPSRSHVAIVACKERIINELIIVRTTNRKLPKYEKRLRKKQFHL